MAIGTSNISFSGIQTEFGGSNPIGLSEYYRGGSFVPVSPSTANIPTSGAIRVDLFKNSSYRWIVSITLSSATTNFNVYDYLVTTYGAFTAPVDVTVTINSGVWVYATSTGNAGFTSGTGWVASSTLTIVNNGYIAGMGGAGGGGGAYSAGAAGSAGGNALNIHLNTTINNGSGYILGGGGGGGGGGSFGFWTGYSEWMGGGGGGGGISFQTSSGAGTPGRYMPFAYVYITQEPGNGGNSTPSSGGSAGQFGRITWDAKAADYSTSGEGGTGAMSWGAAGSNGGTSYGRADSPYGTPIAYYGGGSGGAGGKAINLNGYSVTFTAGNNSSQVQGAVS